MKNPRPGNQNHTIIAGEADVAHWRRAAKRSGWTNTDWACHWLDLAARKIFLPEFTPRQLSLGCAQPDSTTQFQFRVTPEQLARWTDAAVSVYAGPRDRAEWQRQVLNAAALQTT